VVGLLTFSTDAVLRVFGLRPIEEPPVSEEEIKVLVEQGTQAGVFMEAEQHIVGRVFRLSDRTVSSIMTPRLDIVWLNLEDPWEENSRKIAQSVYSRLPVCQGELDEVVGIVQAKELLRRALEGESLDLSAALKPPVFVPETLPALKLLESLKESRTHIVLVLDEFGVVQGLVTLHDILEEVVGDLPAVDESDEAYAVQRDDGSWLLDGALPIDDFKHIFQLDKLPGDELGSYQALSGFVMLHMGRVPNVADQFDFDGLHFEIMDMDGPRIDKVLVSRATPPPSME
jgi:putative hemolysin